MQEFNLDNIVDCIRLDNLIENATSVDVIVGDMTEDEFKDWLDLGTIEEIKCAICELAKNEMYNYVSIANRYLSDIKENYNKSKEV